MNVSVIIVNYNTRELLGQCLESVFEMTRDIAFEVIVVDNASSDGSEEYTTSKFADVVWVNSGGNLGFGRANNLGAEHAKGEYLFLLNSDTILKNNALKIFYDYMQSHKDEQIGALGAWLLDSHGNINHSHGEFPSAMTELTNLWGRIFKCNHTSCKEANVGYVIGADLFVPKYLFSRLNGFDPKYFMYFEDTDLQFRMKQLGYNRRLIIGPQIIHLDGGSFETKGLSFKRYQMAQESCYYYINTHFSGWSLIIYHFVLCTMRLMLFLTKWSLSEKLIAYKQVLNMRSSS